MKLQFWVRYNHNYTVAKHAAEAIGGSVTILKEGDKNAGGRERKLQVLLPDGSEAEAYKKKYVTGLTLEEAQRNLKGNS